MGNLIALMVEEGEDWKGVEVPADADKAPQKPAAAKAPSGDAAPQKEKSGSPVPAAAAAPAAPPAASKPASSQTEYVALVYMYFIESIHLHFIHRTRLLFQQAYWTGRAQFDRRLSTRCVEDPSIRQKQPNLEVVRK